MNKRTNTIRLLIAIAISAFVHPVFATVGESYVSLDKKISEKCGLSFRHPKRWRMFYVEPESNDVLCIIAYRDEKFRKRSRLVPMLESWRETSDGGFILKNISVRERLAEFNFKIHENGEIHYLGEAYTDIASKAGYSPTHVDHFDVIRRDRETLYVGYSHSFQTVNANGKTKTMKSNKLDLLYGNEFMSVGDTSSESEGNSELHGYNTIYENIYKSMRFLKQAH